MAAHHKRQAIPVVCRRSTAESVPAGAQPIAGLPPAPHGHEGGYVVAGILHVCGCGLVRISALNLLRHHDDVRIEHFRDGLARLRAAAVAEIAAGAANDALRAERNAAQLRDAHAAIDADEGVES